MSAPWFRTTDLARWGASNSGGDLSATQFDENTWYFYEQIQALVALPLAVGIDYFTVSGNQLTVRMTDHTNRGPYTIPTAAFNWRGDWTPTTVYLVNDVFTANGQIYIVIWNHTSGATFSAGANDGMGHNYYALMLSTPGNALPTGGAVGQMLAKTTTADFAVAWAWPLPVGGTTNQILMKNSNTNQDADWRTSPFVWAPPVSPPAVPGQVLATVDGTYTNTEWVDANTGGVGKPPASPAGSIGQGIVSVDGTITNMEWAWLILAPTASGATGQGLSTVDGTPTNMQWVDLFPYTLTGTATDGDQIRYDDFTSRWINRQVVSGTVSGTTVTITPDVNPRTDLTPTGNTTVNVSGGKIGQVFIIRVTTSGTTSYTLTFSGGFIATGTLATGTVGGKQYILTFMCDEHNNAWEISRNGPF